jgi:TRAP-type C4-dicarboxylate transport system substrate-binding protein
MRVRSLLVVIALAVLTLAGGVDDASAQAKWKAVAVSRPTPQFTVFTGLGEEIDKRTGGAIKTDVVSLPELGLTGFELVRATRAGLVDIADVLPTYVAGDLPALEGVDLPGLYKDLDTAVKAHVAWMDVVRKYEDKLGGVAIGAYLWPHQIIFSKKPVKGPDDLKGLKVRVFGTAQTEFARALGMEAVSIPFAEVYTALERGTVDAALTGTYSGFSLKWYEVSKYLVEVNHGPVLGIALVSKRSWDKLPPDQQAALREAGKAITEKGWEIGRRTSQEGIDESKKKGMEYVAITPAMAAAVKKVAAEVVVPGWAKRAGPDAKALFNQYLAPHTGITIP